MIEKNKILSDLYQDIQARARDKKTFVDLQDETITYRQLLDCVHKTVALFRAREIERGTRIILLTPNDKQTMLLFVAALLEGLTPIILPADAKSDRVEAIARKVAPSYLFLDADLIPRWRWLKAYRCIAIAAKEQQHKGLLGRLLHHDSPSAEQYPDVLEELKDETPACCASKDHITYLLFTSGTTSTPKGIPVTHENVFEHLQTLKTVFAYDATKRIFNNLSLAHADGLVQGPLLALFSGALLIRPQAFSIHNIESLFNSIYKNRVTHFITVPTVLSLADRLLAHDDYFSGEEFYTIVSVAAKIDPNLWQRLEDRFKVRICNMYGLSETVSGGLFCGPDDATYALGTIGKPIDMEAQIIDAGGNVCGINEEGELWLKGKNVIPGYFDEPEATAELFAGEWLRTGDVARQRPDGRFEIVGRKKTVIISGGFNVHPDEITETLLLHSAVNEAVTVGLPDRDWGELVVAVVESDQPIEEETLIDHCRSILEGYKVPKKIVRIEKLPRGISGKVRLQEVKAIIADTLDHSGCSARKIDLADIIHLAASVFKTTREQLKPDRHPRDTPGWDSLGHLNLIAAVERQFNIQFSIEEMIRIDSLRCLHTTVVEKI